METLRTTAAANRINVKTQEFTLEGWFEKQAQKFENSRLGWMAIYITVQTCLGSIAVMQILQSHGSDVFLALTAMVTMASNSIFIAQGPAKWCLVSFYLSIIVNTAMILISVF